ncbi:GlxA family transcriptional regulator [Solimonas marina]|uniref:Helix-turn-helix domain-containing protein n=1 Tax=Solimonas marina TaxID=2714601 RepID=A0A969WA21_9GAMM|nr:helix-turn-helix domain-containing protein [Solimonas marina]NKF21090.1 helix-turn-helix domain-containing protein [Solimonas marina]
MLKRIAVLGYDGANALDICGPLEAFASANTLAPEHDAAIRYELIVLADGGRPFTTESGLMMQPHAGLDDDIATIDTVIVPGGAGLREAAANARITGWLQTHAAQIRRIASVCTGIYGLAATGLLDGRRAATHWRFADDVARRFPKLRVDGDAIFVRDGRFYTSAGITAGIDLTLALIEEDAGAPLALGVARDLVVYLKRPGGQEQFSEPLRRQMRGGDPFDELLVWMAAHLQQDLSVATLAARVYLSPRQFSRRFTTQLGNTPADYVTDLRLREARRLLDAGELGIDAVAQTVGFRSADVFRRAFDRRFGLAPQAYRRRFPATARHDADPCSSPSLN